MTEFLLIAAPSFMDMLPTMIINLALLAFFAILFLQSGIDKITDRKGNLAWLEGHFEKSPLGSMVPLLLTVITVMEMATGILSLIAIGTLFSAITETIIGLLRQQHWQRTRCSCFFWGREWRKTMKVAAGIVPYFMVAIVALICFAMQL